MSSAGLGEMIFVAAYMHRRTSPPARLSCPSLATLAASLPAPGASHTRSGYAAHL